MEHQAVPDGSEEENWTGQKVENWIFISIHSRAMIGKT
jgi:hypothetical protein